MLRFKHFMKFPRHSIRLSSTATNTDVSDNTSTHFGFTKVTSSEKEQKVYKVFENVAESYDVMNDAMSGGIHRLWKDYFMDRLAPVNGTHLLDVAGGTGDIAFRFLNYIQNDKLSTGKEEFFELEIPSAIGINETDSETQAEKVTSQPTSHVTVCDINQAMLNVGKKRAKEKGLVSGINWLQGNAESLPVENNYFDAYTIAYGIRNCTHIDKVLAEAHRVLKPGGRFMCLEFSQVSNPLLSRVYDQYSFQVIPVLGQLIAADWKSYQYLVESIRKFPPQEDFAKMIRAAGFSAVTFENLLFGVSAIHSGFKL